ncbi:hypothetical protein JW905_08300, partial [bacterium]|nr:hypothetical protein [candidate division CSSED10-310 bacterium]
RFVGLLNPFGSGQRASVTLGAQPGTAYLADGGNGVRTIDYSDPGNPVEVGGFNTPGSTSNIVLAGDRLLVGDQRALEILDIGADPLNPTRLGQFRTTGNPLWGEASGDTVFLADSYSVQTLDISDPADPGRLDAFFTNHAASPYRLYKRGTVLYVAGSSGGLLVFDCADPVTLSLMAQVPDDHSKTYLTLGFVGSYLYAPGSQGDIDIYDISEPAQPILVKTVALNGDFPRILVDGDRVFLSNQSEGISVLDASDPINPRLAGRVDTSGYAEGIAVDGDLLLVADVYSFQIFRLTEAAHDATPPVTVIVSPEDGQAVAGKYVDIMGCAMDPGSGIQLVEVSTNGGYDWSTAQGQEDWNHRWFPGDDVDAVVMARSRDWAGNTEDPPVWVSFPFSLLRPMVLFAGFGDAYLPYTSNLGIAAVVQDPVNVNAIDRLELFYDGLPTGVELELVDIPEGRYALYYSEYAWASNEEASYLIELVPFDVWEHTGASWPWLEVRH